MATSSRTSTFTTAFMRFVSSGLVTALILAPALAGAQSLLDRTPSVSGNWTGAPGSLYFHFIHRFTTTDAPARKVSNVPTFLIGAGLPKRLFAGVNYSTNSTLTPNFPNEWELIARWLPLAQDYDHPLDLGAQVGYNNAAEGVDAELSVARRLGFTRVLLAGRALSNPSEQGNVQYAAAGGVIIRLGTFVALTGDVATLTDRLPTERVAWSAGLHMAIPFTPHTFSLHATNTLVSTLQGASRGGQNVRYGFEFTVPVTLRRYFGKQAQPATVAEPALAAPAARIDSAVAAPLARVDSAVAAPVVRADSVARPAPDRPPPSVAARDTARARPAPRPAAPRRTEVRVRRAVIKNVSYLQPRIEVTVGTTVEWTNSDPLPHTVTATDKSFDSGLIPPSKTYRHTFSKPGTYNFYCTPHPFMKGAVVVRAGAQ